jgi:hypothetical protein
VEGSLGAVLKSPIRCEDAEASLFRFEANFGGGSSTKAVLILRD